jgi:hypothetical protein
MSTSIVSKRKMGFTSSSVYRRKEPHAFTYLSERATFWIAIISVFAFVTGNMVGQHGWHVFWKSVLGEGIERTITFTGTVPPVKLVPDYEKWGKLGGNPRTHTFRQVPQDLLVPLTPYIRHGDDVSADPQLKRVYFVEHLATYDTGRGEGSHPGVDISLPEGTPIQSIANGVVEKVGFDAGGFGNYVVIKHPNVPDGSKGTKALHSVYAHLSSSIVREGEVVNKGDEIAVSGKTGNVTAPHLHFQLDDDDAPWHPYWLFTSADLREAKLSYTQGVDEGLNRDRGLEFTLDPMLFVQANASYNAPVIVNNTQPTVQAPARALSVADRRAARLSKRVAANTLVAIAEDAPIIVIPAQSSISSSSSVVHSAAPIASEIASIDVRHDGSFTARTWEKLTLVLLDADGDEITRPTGSRKFGLTTAFGKAEFKPSTFTTADFRDGRLTVEALPLGEQTIVVQVEPLKTLSKPIKVSK